MATVKQRIGWKLDKIKRGLMWPMRAWREFRRLYKTMGPKGVFWYMAIQGRWHYGVTLFLSLVSLPLLYGVLLQFIKAQDHGLLLLLVVPPAALVGLLHYILWRRSTYMRTPRWRVLTRFYAAPIMVLVGVMFIAVVAKIVFYIVSGVTKLF